MSFKDDYKSAFGAVSPDTGKIIAGVHEKLNENAPTKIRAEQNKKKPFRTIIGSAAVAAACAALVAAAAFRLIPNLADGYMNIITKGIEPEKSADYGFAGGYYGNYNNNADESLVNSNESFYDSSQSVNGESPSYNGEGSDSSRPAEITAVPVEFTDEDREVEAILSDLQPPANEIYGWLCGGSAPQGEIQVRFADYDGSEIYTYYRFGGRGSDDLLEKPTSWAEMEKLILDYFSADRTERFFNKYFAVCSAVENADGTYTLKSEDGRISSSRRYTLFIEVDGELYHLGIDPASGIYIFPNSVKVVSRTDDTIEFTYLYDHWAFTEENSEYLNNAELYSINAIKGTLKYERGGWKLDSF